MGLEIPDSADIKNLIQIERERLQTDRDRLEIEEFIAKILGAKPRAYFESVTTINGITIRGEIKSMELKEGQYIDVEVALKTKAGHPAKYQAGTEKFALSDETTASVTPNPDDPTNPLKARVTATDGTNNSSNLLTFTADGDPAADVTRDIVATLDLVITQGDAFVAEITAGAPTNVP